MEADSQGRIGVRDYLRSVGALFQIAWIRAMVCRCPAARHHRHQKLGVS